MAKTKISEFSATPGNNTDIDGINIAEGCAPSGINDAIRELMAQLKDFQAGTAGDSFNGPVGTSTAAAGAFTTLSASGAVTLSGGTANGVAYLNGSKVLTTGSALYFDGTNFGTTGSIITDNAKYFYGKSSGGSSVRLLGINASDTAYVGPIDNGPTSTIFNASSTSAFAAFYASGSEGMRLTSTGLGIGTSSPAAKLTVQGDAVFRTASGNVGFSFTGATASYSTYLNDADSSYRIYYGGSDRLVLSSFGNLGLGVTPSAWGGLAGGGALQGYSFGIWSPSGTATTYFGTNTYQSAAATFRYSTTAASALYSQQSGAHAWFTAPSGTAGNAISFTQAMTLDASGRLGVGTTSPTSQLHVVSSGTTLAQFTGAQYSQIRHSDGTRVLYTQVYDNQARLFVESATPLLFGTSDTERARIDTSGNLLVGLTSATGVAKLQVSGPLRTTGYTVATLPAGTVGMRTYVTDALAPTFGATVAAGGAVTIPVFYNGTNWIVG